MSSKIGHIGNSGLEVFTSLDGHFAVSDALSQLLETTKYRLLISSPWIGKGFVDLIRKVVPEGVCINILTRHPKENGDNSFEAINAFFELAESCKWKIEINCTSRHHPKFLVVDNSSCLAGSLNPTDSGIYYNLELGFVIKDSCVIKRIIDFFFQMWQTSVSWQTVKQFNAFERAYGASVQNRIAEKYIGIFFANGNAPLPKWKAAKELENLGYEEKDIIEVENYLLRRGTLYEPRPDWVCLTCVQP